MAVVEHELDAPPWQRFESTLMATSRTLRSAYDLRLSAAGLNLSEACLLTVAAADGPISQTRLADRFGMGRAAAGSIIDALASAGLVRREADPSDRRVWLVAVTEPGQEVVATVRAIDGRLREELRSGLSKADRDYLAQTLLRIQCNLRSVLADG